MSEDAAPQAFAGYQCTPDDFRPSLVHDVRWLDPDQDLELFDGFWPTSVTADDVRRWAEEGFTYAATLDGAGITSIAAIWTYSTDAAELAAVAARADCRRRGLALSVCSFITRAIFETRQLATCSTLVSNLGMQRTAEALGYQRTR